MERKSVDVQVGGELGYQLSLGPLQEKYWFADEARVIVDQLGLPIYATPGTAEALRSLGIPCTSVGNPRLDGGEAIHVIEDGTVDLVINIPKNNGEKELRNDYIIRRMAIEL